MEQKHKTTTKPSTAEMAYEDVLTYLGEFGRYQKRIYLLLCFPAMACALHKLSGVFLQARVDHRCQLPYELENATYNISEIHMTIPWDKSIKTWSRCERLDANFTEEYFNNGIPVNKTVECNKWIYDRSKYKSTAVTEWNLVCSDAHFRVMADSLFMVGALIGSITFGAISDRYGRRPIFFISLVVQIIFGMLTAFAPAYFTFIVCRMIIGSTTSGLFLVAYIISVEMVGPSKRMLTGVVCQMFYTAGYILTAGLAYFITDWRLLQIALTAPGALLLLYWWFVPESVRWLLVKGRTEEAKALLQKAAKENKVIIPNDVLDNLLPESNPSGGHASQGNSMSKSGDSKEKQAIFLDLLRYPNLRKKTLVILFSWFVNSGSYYGLSWNTSSLGGNDYINFLLSGVVEIPGYTFLLFTLNRWGCKLILCGCMLAWGAALFCTIFVPAGWPLIMLAMIGKMIITASYGAIYVFSSEQFPTVVRNMGLGAALTCARVGGILAPYTLLLADFWRPLPMLVFGVFAFIGGGLSLLLPETLNTKLPDTIDEGEIFGRSSKNEKEEFCDDMIEMTEINNSRTKSH